VGADRSQLHLGHYRQSKGRRLPSSRRLPERDRQCDHFRPWPRLGLSLDLADVPLQRLDLPLGGDGGGRHTCLPAPCRSGANLRRDRRASGYPFVRRADRAQYARTGAGNRKTPLRPYRRDRYRRRRAAFGGDRGHGADGISGHSPLWSDRKLRPFDRLRLAGGVVTLASCRSIGAHGAPGGGLSDPRSPAGGRPADHDRCPRRWPHIGRAGAAQQHGDEGIFEEPGSDRSSL